jgi:hypothetical protein
MVGLHPFLVPRGNGRFGIGAPRSRITAQLTALDRFDSCDPRQADGWFQREAAIR